MSHASDYESTRCADSGDYPPNEVRAGGYGSHPYVCMSFCSHSRLWSISFFHIAHTHLSERRYRCAFWGVMTFDLLSELIWIEHVLIYEENFIALLCCHHEGRAGDDAGL